MAKHRVRNQRSQSLVEFAIALPILLQAFFHRELRDQPPVTTPTADGRSGSPPPPPTSVGPTSRYGPPGSLPPS